MQRALRFPAVLTHQMRLLTPICSSEQGQLVPFTTPTIERSGGPRQGRISWEATGMHAGRPPCTPRSVRIFACVCVCVCVREREREGVCCVCG
jgi:hypothetical protein